MIDQSLFDPDAVQAQQLDNRQRLAQMMIQQGMDERVYSPAAGIAKALTIALGHADAGQADRSMMALAQQKQAGHQAELANIIAAATAPQGNTSDVPGGGPPVSMANPGVPGAAGAGAATGPGGGRFELAKLLATSHDPQVSQAGLSMLLKGPDAPIVKETADGLVVMTPDGMHVLNKIGGAKIAPPSVADATPESLAKYQQTGDASVLVSRIKQVPVDTGNGIQFVNPENPGSAAFPKTMSPGEAASNAREVAQMRDKGIAVPGTSGPPTGGALGYGNMGTVTPQQQNARDDGRMQTLLNERQQQIAATGKSDPALETEIADMQRKGFGGAPAMQRKGFGGAPATAPTAAATAPGLSPADARAVASQTAQNLAKGSVDYKTALDGRVQSGADLMLRLNEAQQALDHMKTGMGSETRLNVARAASAMHLPDSVVNGIAGGDISSMQVFQKLAAQQAMESLKQAMGGTGRITQAEFKVFQANNPNIELQPDAIQKIFTFYRDVFNRDQSEQNAMTTYLKDGGNISQWPTVWTQTQLRAGLMNPKAQPASDSRTVVRTGTLGGRRVVQYSDGTTDYAN